jgi:anaerobic selenocysteine-containing dehydrogenase
MTARDVRSYCRICGAVCGLVVTVDGSKVLRVRGDDEHPLSRGYTCSKGRAVAAMHDHPARLDHPLVRRPGEPLRPAGWNDVLDDLGARLAGILRESGPDAVAFYVATGSSHDALGGRYVYRLAHAIGTRSKYSAVSLDSPCKPLVAELMAGRDDLLPSLDQERATLTVMLGINPVVSHGHFEGYSDPVSRLRSLGRGDRELWVIDPRRSETARLATRHLQPRPGSDWAILAFAIRSLLAGGGADLGYLADHAEGVDRLREAVEWVDLDEAVRRTGLAAADLTDFVGAIRRHGVLAGQTGTGTTMSRAANVTEWLLWALHVVTASYDRPGGMWFNPGFLSRHDQRSVAPAPWPPAPGPPSRPELPSLRGEYPSAALVDEVEAGNVRALIAFGGNPLNALPQPDRVARAMAGLDVLAVADIYATETTAAATHVLPCTAQLERADVTAFLDQFLPVVSAQYSPRVVEPAAQRRPAWQIWAEIGQRLDLRVLPEGVDHRTVTEDELLGPIVDRGRRPFAELQEAGVLVHDQAVFGWVEAALPGGRWRVAPEPLVAQLTELRAIDDDAHPLVLVPRRQVRHMNSAMRTVTAAGGRADAPDVIVNALDAAAAGVADGDDVRVSSQHGSFVAPARVSDQIRRGVVSLPHGWSGAAAVGRLVSSDTQCDPLTGMPLQSGVPVRIERVTR